MKSKYILGILAVAGAMSTLTSCDDFLNDNRYPLSQQTVNSEFWNNSENVQNQINYFYEDYSGYGNGTGSGTFYWSWLSDDQSGRTAFADWTFPNTVPSSSSWNAPYVEIRRANQVIKGVEQSTLNESDKTNFLGLARMYRARGYYDLVRRYGDVPLVTTPLDPADDAALFGPRTARNTVMDFVLEDLNYAVQNIAAQSGKTIFSKDMAQAFKAEVCLTEGTYARYHQNDDARAKKFLQESVDAATAIADKYPLGNYIDLYTSTRAGGGGFEALNNNAEIIMFKPYEKGVFMNSISDYSNATDGVAGITRDAFDAFVFKDGKPAALTSYDNTDHGVPEGDYGVSISNLLSVRDGRLSAITYDHIFFQGMTWTPGNTGGQWSSTGYGVAKFNNLLMDQADLNVANRGYLSAPLYWGGRLYVTLLEAKAELGNLSDADITKYMKPLWDRAGIDTSNLNLSFLTNMNDPANNMNVSSLIWEIRRLRRCELMLDDGLRYWDLVRWHQLDKLDFTKNPKITQGAYCANSPVQPGQGSIDGYVNASWKQTRTFEDKYYLYPIPTGQIQLNDKLEQNPGWK